MFPHLPPGGGARGGGADDLRIMSRCDSIGTDLAGDCAKRVEFHPAVAEDVGVWCLAVLIYTDHRLKHLMLILRTHILHDERDAEVRSNAMRHGEILAPRASRESRVVSR